MPALALSRVGARVVESGPGGQDLAAGAWQRLEALPDPRSPRGRGLPLPPPRRRPARAAPARGGGARGTGARRLGVAEQGGGLLDPLEAEVKQAETSHCTALLGPADLDGAVVTFDALHTVRANLGWLVTDKKAHYIAVVKRNQPLLHAQVRALPWRQVPAGSLTRGTGHGRAETRTLKAPPRSHLDFPHARQAIKITRWRQGTATGQASRHTVYARASSTSPDA